MLSIIVPAHNEQDYILKTIDSIKNEIFKKPKLCTQHR